MRLCVGSSKGIIILDPDRGSAPLMVHAEPAPVWCLAADCQDSQFIYAGSNECVTMGNARGMRTLARSCDGGRSWEDITPRGTADEDTWTIAASPVTPDQLFVGTSRGRMLRSDDGGRTFAECLGLREARARARWEPGCAGHSPRIRSIAFDPRSPTTLYVAVERGGVLRSRDEGLSFEALDGGLHPDVHGIAVSPYDSRLLYAATGGGFYRSENAGASWARIQLDCVRTYALSVLAAPEPAGLVLTAAGFGPPQTWGGSAGARARVFRSVDHGRTFNPVLLALGEDPTPAMIMGIVQNQARPQELFAITNRGFALRSQDRGETFAPMAASLPPAYSLVVLA
jgi:photosystem II stability/assembly factor-like uncharacterized protein